MKRSLALVLLLLLTPSLLFASHDEARIENEFFRILGLVQADYSLSSEDIAKLTQSERQRIKRGYYEFFRHDKSIFRYQRQGGRGYLKYKTAKSKNYMDQQLLKYDVRNKSRGMSVDNTPIWNYEGLTNLGYTFYVKIYGCTLDPDDDNCIKEVELTSIYPSKKLRIMDR